MNMQPTHAGVNKRGEIVWKMKPMASWQKEMIGHIVRVAGAMCPQRYMGDFRAFWEKLARIQTLSLEIDAPNFAGFMANVPGSQGERLMQKNKRKHHPGD